MKNRGLPNRNIFSSHLKGPLFVFLALFLVFSFTSQAAAVTIPAGGAVKPDGSRLYVPNVAGTLEIYNTATGKIVKSISTTGVPYGMVVSPDGNYLYVSVGAKIAGGDTKYDLQIFNIGAGDPTALSAWFSFGTNRVPAGIAMTPDGKTLYIADNLNGKVYIVDVTNPLSPTKVGEISGVVGTPFYGVAVKPDGSRLYVSSLAASGSIYVYDISGSNKTAPVLKNTVSGLAYPSYLVVSNDGNKLLVRIAEKTGHYYDVKIYNTAGDTMTLSDEVAASPAGNDQDPGNAADESLSISPNGLFFYITHYRASNAAVHTYAFLTADPNALLPKDASWEVWGYDTSKDFSVVSPNGKRIYLTYSNGGTYVSHEGTGVATNEAPTAPKITYPLTNASNVIGDATWTAAVDDGRLTSTLTYLIQTIEASQINTNNWVDTTFTTNLSIPLYLLNLGSNKSYYLRIRAYDGTDAGTTANPGAFKNGNFGPYAYTGPFTTGIIVTPPSVYWVDPNHGPVLTTVEVHGVNFGATKGTSTITIGGATATVTSWGDTTIKARVPASLSIGPAPIVVTVSGQASNNNVYFTVTNGTNPVISELDPNSGYTGDYVTIRGYYFGATQGTSTVSFNATGATVLSWSDNEIVVTVPSLAAGTYPVRVTVGGVQSNAVNFQVLGAGPGTRPQISSIVPTKGVSITTGPTATTVTINGINFGATQNGSTVTFVGPNGSSLDAAVSTWSTTQIVVTVPPTAVTGIVRVQRSNGTSNGLTFTVLTVPTNLTVPTVGDTYAIPSWFSVPGADLYTISYGTDTNASNIRTVATPETFIQLSGLSPLTLYYVKVSAETTAGAVTYYTTPVSFTTKPPSPRVDWIYPDHGPVLTTVGVHGANFGTVQDGSIVTIGGVTAAVNAWSDTSIEAIVPGSLPFGFAPVVVTVGSLPSNNNISYEVYALADTAWINHYNIASEGGGTFSAFINWSAVTGATSYDLRYRIQGTPVWTTLSGLTAPWSNPLDANPNHKLTGLTGNVTYEVSVRANNALGSSAWFTPPHAFFVSAPSLAYISPNNGNRGETLNIKIMGSNTSFVDGTTFADFGAGITLNYVKVFDATHAVANITIGPSAVLGARSISISTGPEVLPATFSVNAAGTAMLLYAIPDNGDQGQTLNVRIIGSNTSFSGSPVVSFSNAGITVNSSAAVSPAEVVVNISISGAAATGPCNVTVSGLTLSNGFTVNPVGTAMLLYASPNNGDQATNGLNVHIFGANTSFLTSGVSGVNFTGSGISVNYYNVISETELVANVNIDAAAATGFRTIAVSSGGTSLLLNNGFLVNASGSPTLLYAIPDNANQGDNLTVRIIGSNTGFNGTTAVSFSNTGITVNSVNVIGSTSVDASISISGSAPTGPGDVTVTTGGVPLTLVSGFTVNPSTSPEILSIVPSSEFQNRTITVAITGRNTNFQAGVTQLSFSGAGITVNSVTVSNATNMTANISISAGAPIGRRDVTVTTGAQIASLANGFEVLPASASILYLVPSSGNQGLQNLNVKIVGNNTAFLQGTTSVVFGAGITVNYVQVLDPANVIANVSISGVAALGPRTVTVTTGAEIVTGTFTVISAATPSLLYVRPDSGYQGVTNLILTVVGTNTAFVDGVTNVTFSNTDIIVNSTRVLDSAHAIVDISIPMTAATGPGDVTATTGAQVVTLSNGFTVYSSSGALLINVIPSYGYQGTNNLVLQIFGVNTSFIQGMTNTSFSGSGITVLRTTVTNQWYATAEVSIGNTATVGPRNVTVQTDGQSVTLVNGFAVLSKTGLWMAIDPFEGTEGINHYTFGSGINAGYDNVTYHDGLQGWRSLYSFVSATWGGGWGGALPGTLDLSNMNCITFWMRGDGSANNVRLEITEADGDIWSSHDPMVTGTGESLSDTNWRQVVVPFTHFKLNISGSTGNGLLDKTIIKYNFIYTSLNTSSANHFVDTIQAELRDLAPPSRIIDLRATKVGTDVRLDWSAATDDIAVLGYRVFTSSSAAGPWAQLGSDLSPATLTLTHAGAVSDAGDHYYYVVAFDASNMGQESNIASIIKRNLTYTVGAANEFWVSVPYRNPYTNAASVLADMPLAVTQISRFNPVSQTWETYARVGGGNNFNIITGEGYEVVINASTQLTFVGSHNPNFAFNLINIGSHLISVPYSATYSDARAIVNSINGGVRPGTTVSIRRLNPSTQGFETLAWVSNPVGFWAGTDFAFVPGEAYEINITGTMAWVPSVY